MITPFACVLTPFQFFQYGMALAGTVFAIGLVVVFLSFLFFAIVSPTPDVAEAPTSEDATDAEPETATKKTTRGPSR